MRSHTAVLAFVCGVAWAQTQPHSTGNRTTPSTINSVSPKGVARGTTAEITVEGLNLARASSVYFDRAGVTGKVVKVKELPDLPDIRLGANGTPSTVDVGPLPPRNQVTIEVEVSPDADIGPVAFRLQNDLGTSPKAQFLIEPYYGESPDREPNDTPENAFETYLPTVLVGTIGKPGDIDYYKIKATAGDEVVFDNTSASVGSSVNARVAIVGEDLSPVSESSEDHFSIRFGQTGTYYIRVSDALDGGSPAHFYRLKVGTYPLVTRAFPLGVQEGKTAEVAITGYNVGASKVVVKGQRAADLENGLRLRPPSPTGPSFSELRLAVGRDPEIICKDSNTTVTAAQPISVPVTINGRIKRSEYFRFHAAKDQKIVFDVEAARLGSELDSLIEILDANGKPVQVATARGVQETAIALRDHGSADRGVRLASFTGLTAGDYLLAGNEVMRIEALPHGPDEDVLMEAFGGKRLAYFGTTPEAHALDKPVYKVQIRPAGEQFTPNGLPLVRLYARNDDGGAGWGRDSYLAFTAPAEGDYLIRVSDVRGLGGEDYAYRLNVRPLRPDFRLSVMPSNPNVPVGGVVPITVTAMRIDGLEAPIDVKLENLPSGVHATEGRIAAGQKSTVLLLGADPDAKVEHAAPLNITGRAKAGSEYITHYASPEDHLKLIALMPKPDILVTAQTKEVTVDAGGTAQIKVAVERQNGFGGRVPIEVRNLPPRVAVQDVGLNGVLVNEGERERTFTIEALPSAEPGDQLIYISGFIETRASTQNSYAAPQPVVLHVRPKRDIASR